MKQSLYAGTVIVVMFAIFIVFNSVVRVGFRNAYSDLTEDKLYSLSSGTKNILEKLEGKITLRFYFSKTEGAKFSGIKLYGSRVLELLREYERNSRGKVMLEVFDPRPDSEEEEWAQRYGISPITMSNGEHLYFGLAGVNALGKEEVIRLFDLARQQFLEYDVTNLVYSLSSTKKPVVALFSSLDVTGEDSAAQPPNPFMQQQQDRSWIFVQQLRQSATLKVLKGDFKEIEKDVEVLVLIHPKQLSEDSLYAIDQYVLYGGKLIVLVDPYSDSDVSGQDPSNPMGAMFADRSSNLEKLFKAWGVELFEKHVVADLELATLVGTPQGDTISFPLWLSLEREQMDSSDVVTANLENVFMPWPGALKVEKKEGIEVIPLITTSKRSQLIEERSYRFGGGNPDEILRNFVSSEEKQNIAVRLNGNFNTAFTSGKPKADGEPEKDPVMSKPGGHLFQSARPTSVIVVADVDFLADRYAASVQNLLGQRLIALRNGNLIFFQNAVENLFGSSDLISLRSRGRFSRPFTKVIQIEANARERFQKEETEFTAKLNAANERLQTLMAASNLQQTDSDKALQGQVFNAAVFEEVRKLREERNKVQQQLREVRRNLRHDKEKLGQTLFLLNTFLVPAILIILSMTFSGKRKAMARSGNN